MFVRALEWLQSVLGIEPTHDYPIGTLMKVSFKSSYQKQTIQDVFDVETQKLYDTMGQSPQASTLPLLNKEGFDSKIMIERLDGLNTTSAFFVGERCFLQVNNHSKDFYGYVHSNDRGHVLDVGMIGPSDSPTMQKLSRTYHNSKLISL